MSKRIVKTRNGAVEIQKLKNREYVLTARETPDCRFIFTGWDLTVIDDLDGDSDEASCWGYSTHLRYLNNVVDLTPTAFIAPSWKALEEALSYVDLNTYDPYDI